MIEKLTALFNQVKTFVKDTYLFAIAAGVVVLSYMLSRKTDEVRNLKEDIRREKVGRELAGLVDQANGSSIAYKQASERYRALKEKHPDLFTPKAK